MDNTAKYLHFRYDNKDPFEIVQEIISKGRLPLFAIKEIMEKFPAFSLIDAKEVVIIATSEYKSLYDYQGNLFTELEKLSEVMK
ncbi:hypothetical protein EG359_18710 [Chryseobacterium joostei]|uniref:DUF433 domain-containing protein n=1 Tax=Chryseobacterium joostei TaxID=112234 RepID=A0A1N7J092_9FLAO|nr:hypothetical protein [Chryseobacterium joostei]AZB01514.1 hypothetical protein EG359_18710 [Chryseobacterium joostei]SIS42730.1 hypothetical protein SAMN05421768_107112 [Chryseobacterium joostei]